MFVSSAKTYCKYLKDLIIHVYAHFGMKIAETYPMSICDLITFLRKWIS
jgi:hypothetical protein